MDDRAPADVAALDQGQAAAADLGRMRARYYRALVDGGAPRWLAAAVTLIHAWGADVAARVVEVCIDDEE